jgi:hypothetical protein
LGYNEEKEKYEDLIVNICNNFPNLLQECITLEGNLKICMKYVSEKGLHPEFYKYQILYLQLMIEEES